MSDPASPGAAYVRVAIEGPFQEALTWSLPEALIGVAARGKRALVPFRQRSRTGLILSLERTPPAGVNPSRVRPVADILDAEPLLPEPQLALLEWIADYYRAPIGDVARLVLPSGAERETQTEARRLPGSLPADATDPLLLRILDALPPGDTLPVDRLLHAVPGARHYHLAALAALDLLALEYSASDARVPMRTRTLVTATGTSPERPLGAQQMRILDLLADGPASWDEIRELYGCARSTLHSLVKRGLVTTCEEEVRRDPFARVAPLQRDADPTLTDGQEHAVAQIRDAIERRSEARFLLHGITGSGKTEVYVHAMRCALAQGRSALLLLPEIGLTPQFVAIFRGLFGDRVAALHSGLTPGERQDEWRRIRRGEATIVIGARSALFAPLATPGLIIVDEEHDASFKQEDGVRYHARDCALMLGRLTGATTVLGSATPSLESWHNARRGVHQLLQLPERANRRPLPHVDFIDMRYHPADPEDPAGPLLSAPLQAAVRDTVRAGEQVILFLNRRGYAPTLACHDCGEVLRGTDCQLAYTYHRRGDVLKCHHCGFSTPAPENCPTCGSANLLPGGAGTEQIEERIADAFPDLRVGRLDRDAIRRRSADETLRLFRRGELDLLVGTQMVTKGHDFPNVTLVGVLNADQSLRFPDFRSGERTFQLLTQVAGRAGRAERPGRVLVQTHDPGHFVLQHARTSDFRGFADAELPFRERLTWPPFAYMVAIRLDAPDEDALARAAERIAQTLRTHGDPSLIVHGPVDAPLRRVRRRSRMHITLRAARRAVVRHAAHLASERIASLAAELRKGDIRVHIDVDPVSLL